MKDASKRVPGLGVSGLRTSHLYILILWMSVIAWAAPAGGQGQETATITGEVTTDGKPVPNAPVVLELASDPSRQIHTESDGAGRFRFDAPAGVKYRVKVVNGVEASGASAEVIAGQSSDSLQLDLRPQLSLVQEPTTEIYHHGSDIGIEGNGIELPVGDFETSNLWIRMGKGSISPNKVRTDGPDVYVEDLRLGGVAGHLRVRNDIGEEPSNSTKLQLLPPAASGFWSKNKKRRTAVEFCETPLCEDAVGFQYRPAFDNLYIIKREADKAVKLGSFGWMGGVAFWRQLQVPRLAVVPREDQPQALEFCNHSFCTESMRLRYDPEARVLSIENKESDGEYTTRARLDWDGSWQAENVATTRLTADVVATEEMTAKVVSAARVNSAEIVLDTAAAEWPDYVFDPDYELMSLEELARYTRVHRRLPGIPAAGEVGAEGVDLGKFNVALLVRVEELTRHVIEQGEKIVALERELGDLRGPAR